MLGLLKRIRTWYCTRKVKANCAGFSEPLRVNGYSRVTRKTRLGKNVNFNGLRVFGNGDVSIGDNFHSGTGIRLYTSIHNYDEGEAIPYDHTVKTKTIMIGDNVWLGDNVSIIGDASIGEGAIIQTASVVVGDIPALAIAGGHPAKVFGQRNVEHYRKLKKLGKFF